MTGEIVPKIASAGSIDVGLALFERKFIGHGATVIVSVLLAAISDLPGLLVVVAGNGRVRPIVSVAGDFSAVVKIVQHPKLQSQLVQVGRHVSAVHGQRRIAIAHLLRR